MVKNLPAMWETSVWSLGWEDPQEKGMATQPSILAWRIPRQSRLVGSSPLDSQESDRNEWLTHTCCCCCEVASVVSDSVWPHRRQPTRLPCPWDSPGKNTGVGCHFLLQCMKVKSESEVAQSCPTLHDPMDWSLPGSSIHGIFQARVLEWVAIAFSTRGSSQPNYQTRVSCIGRWILYHSAT